ncbi:helix-turn-helix domain-containing protein [Catellatospora vulcania]|uniref:helix-turn-helix domain-containing protein n=1 Tax=Catellatospora vulcania TaxID=1460450 RepID=UPI0012D44ED6|nr:AraC family transcriptional regulator [Catellatospora vulcania]
MRQPRRDTRGIVDPAELLRQVRFRRLAPAAELAELVEHYWFLDWDLDRPFEQHVVGHPAVNLFVQRPTADDPVTCEVSGVDRELFSVKLAEQGWVRGVRFRPGAFRAFSGRTAAELTGRRVPLAQVLPVADPGERLAAAATDPAAAAVLDELLLSLRPEADEPVRLAMRLVHRIRHDRELRRVEQLAQQAGLSVRSLQRLFTQYVGIGPKQVILRYRVHGAIERAEGEVDWAAVAGELGYSDQAHLVREVTATIGLPPAAYAASLR